MIHIGITEKNYQSRHLALRTHDPLLCILLGLFCALTRLSKLKMFLESQSLRAFKRSRFQNRRLQVVPSDFSTERKDNIHSPRHPITPGAKQDKIH